MTREEMHKNLNPEADLFKSELIDIMYYSANSKSCDSCKYYDKNGFCTDLGIDYFEADDFCSRYEKK